MKAKIFLIAIIAISATITGCYPDGPETVSDYDVTAIYYDETVDFQPFATYYLPDTVMHVLNSDGEYDESFDKERKYDADILAQIHQNMQDLGYTLISDSETETPDVLVTTAAFGSDYYAVYPWYDYWYGYPWWDNWYGYSPYPYYPSYPWGYSSSYLYSTGTITIEMMATSEASVVENKIPVVWMTALNGILTNNEVIDTNRLMESIDEAFDKSSYLKQN